MKEEKRVKWKPGKVEKEYPIFVACFLTLTWGWTLHLWGPPSSEGEEVCNGNIQFHLGVHPLVRVKKYATETYNSISGKVIDHRLEACKSKFHTDCFGNHINIVFVFGRGKNQKPKKKKKKRLLDLIDLWDFKKGQT